MSYVRTGPAPSPIPINITGTQRRPGVHRHGQRSSGRVPLATSGNTPDTLNLSLNTTGLTAGVYAGVVAVNSVNSINIFQGVPFVLTVTDPPSCGTRSAPVRAAWLRARDGQLSVSTGSLLFLDSHCAELGDNWITIASGGGTGPGNVSFNVSANAGTASRVVDSGGRAELSGHAVRLGLLAGHQPIGDRCHGRRAASLPSTSIPTARARGPRAAGGDATSGTGNGQVQVTIHRLLWAVRRL